MLIFRFLIDRSTHFAGKIIWQKPNLRVKLELSFVAELEKQEENCGGLDEAMRKCDNANSVELDGLLLQILKLLSHV